MYVTLSMLMGSLLGTEPSGQAVSLHSQAVAHFFYLLLMPSVLHEGDPRCKKAKVLSPAPLAVRSPSMFCSPHNRPVNLRDEVSRARNSDFTWRAG